MCLKRCNPSDLANEKAERINELLATVDKTIKKLKGETKIQLKEHYQRFSDEQIEKYRQEVRQRWGDDVLRASEDRVIGMGKERFTALQAEGGSIFKAISDDIPKGFNSAEVQEQVAK